MDLSKEVLAYALQNFLEHGKAKESVILPKLFQHGLEKKDIPAVVPLIKEIVSKVNDMDEKDALKKFQGLKDIVVKREQKEGELPELPGIKKSKKPVFRLAPFPSGALHIGNAKTYLLNALYAEKYNGSVILVMDDTIGSVEKPLVKEAYDLIEDGFKFLGVKYKKVVYKSDRLKTYYKYAEELIKKNKAYVCHCTQVEFGELKKNGQECGCRQFPIGLQQRRWKEMFKMKEGHGVLRIKTSMQHPNPAFRDRVLFKISDRKHVRVGKKYRVWPTLEMSWAIDDKLLGITHIIRGNDLHIETDMERYIWKVLKWPEKKWPEVIHTGLIRIKGLGAKVSKSKSVKQVLSGEFIGWDDPRTWSIQSLARRGITPDAIREFVKSIGLNKQDIVVPIETLYALNRRILDEQAIRYSFVENPVAVKLDKSLNSSEIDVPIHPHKKEKRIIKMGQSIFISAKDFEQFKGKEIRLLHLFNIDLDDESKITSIENKKIPRINWVTNPAKVKVLMPEGIWVSGFGEEGISEIKKDEIVQFERFGFVRFDKKQGNKYEFWFSHE